MDPEEQTCCLLTWGREWEELDPALGPETGRAVEHEWRDYRQRLNLGGMSQGKSSGSDQPQRPMVPAPIPRPFTLL